MILPALIENKAQFLANPADIENIVGRYQRAQVAASAAAPACDRARPLASEASSCYVSNLAPALADRWVSRRGSRPSLKASWAVARAVFFYRLIVIVVPCACAPTSRRCAAPRPSATPPPHPIARPSPRVLPAPAPHAHDPLRLLCESSPLVAPFYRASACVSAAARDSSVNAPRFIGTGPGAPRWVVTAGEAIAIAGK